jgi:hypothetical protein
VELHFEDTADEGRRPRPGYRMHSPCQINLFACDQWVAEIAWLPTGALARDSVATARHVLACSDLNGGFIGISVVAAARRAQNQGLLTFKAHAPNVKLPVAMKQSFVSLSAA